MPVRTAAQRGVISLVVREAAATRGGAPKRRRHPYPTPPVDGVAFWAAHATTSVASPRETLLMKLRGAVSSAWKTLRCVQPPSTPHGRPWPEPPKRP